MKKINILDEAIGWYGMIVIVLAYALISYDFLSPTGMIYQLLNVTGAGGIIWISYKKKVWQSISLNLVWLVIGLIALGRLVL